MAEVTYYVALPFIASDDGAAAGEPTECFNPNAAVMRAEVLSRCALRANPSQRPVVSRGGDTIQSSIAARMATAAPMTTWTVIAVVPWKPNTQGETSVHNPTMRFSHSSQTANAASAAIASTAMTMPAIMAFSEALPASNANIQGEKNRIAPRTRFATSHNFAFVQFSIMTPSIEGSPGYSTERRRRSSTARSSQGQVAPAPRKEGHVGAVAFNRTGDPATGDFSDAKVIRKFGNVPDDLSAV